MEATAHSIPIAGWRSKLRTAIRPAARGRPAPRPVPSAPPPLAAAAAPAPAATKGAGKTVEGVIDALRRSPLGLDLPSDHPGLANVASSLGDEEIAEAALRLVREYGLLDAKAMVAKNLKLLQSARQDDLQVFQALQTDGGSRRPRASAVLESLRRSPLALDLPANTPGLAAVESLSDDEVTAAAVALVREHGLLDAKAMVSSDITVLKSFTDFYNTLANNAQQLLQESEAEFRAAMPGGFAAVLDAIKRSPLMLDLPASTPGLAAVAELADDVIVASCVRLMRVEGMFDAKEILRADASILVDMSKEVARIEAEEAAERAAEEAAALAAEEAEAAAEAGGYTAPAFAAAAAPPATGAAARVVAALKSGPLMLEVPSSTPGLAAAAALDDAMITASCVLLMRTEGWFDAKELIKKDASILVDVAVEVERIEAEEAAARAAEEAAALAAEEAEAQAEAGGYTAPAYAAAPAAKAPAKAGSETARVRDALQRSPLMLDLPASSPGLAEIAALDDAMIVASCVLLMRVEGMFDAKEMIREDASILLDVAEEVKRIEAEEAAERAAEEAAAAAAEAEEAGDYAAPAYAAAPAKAGGEVARVLDALRRSPLMLDLSPDSEGVAEITRLDDAQIIAGCVLLMRIESFADAKDMIMQDATILLDAAKEVARIEVMEAEERAAEEAAALAAEEAQAAAEAGDYAAPAADWYSEPAAYAAPAAKASGETARVLDALQRSPLMLDLPASSPGLAEIAALDDAMIVASCVLLMRVEGMFDAKEMIKKDASILVDVSKEVARIEAEEAAQRAAEEAAALAEAEAEAAAEAGGYAAPAAYSAPTSGGEVGRVIDAIKRSPLMLELPATSRGLEQVTVLADDMIVASCVLLMRQEGMFDAKEMVRSDASVLVPTAKIVERLEAEEAAARAAEEAAAAEAEEAARAEEAAAASADRVPAFASKAAQAVRPDAGRALDAVRRSPLMLDLPKSTPGVSAIATMSDDAIIDGSLYLLREHGLLDAKAMVAKDAAVLKTAAAAASAAAGVPAASKATISAALDAVRRSPLMTDLTGQEGMEAPTLAAIANMSDTEIIDAALTLVSKYGLEDAKALVGKDAKVLLNPKADHSRLMAELRGAPGAEAVAVAASVAAAAAKSRTANAARPPASKSEAALARAQSRSRESPGLALLAGMSIVWNMMGPLGGLFVKFAQHPAANTKGNRKRMGA